MNLRVQASSRTVGLLPLRAVIGLVFLMHGYQKLFVMGVDGVTGFMTRVGVPMPGVSAVVVTVAELAGGAAILLGLFTRLAAAALAFDMLVAILAVRLGGGFFVPRGLEFELTLLGGCLTLALMGAGGVSLDQTLAARRSGAG